MRRSTTRSAIDFINAANGGRERVAIEISAESARELVRAILSALESGEQEHARRRCRPSNGLPGRRDGRLIRP